MKTNQFGVAIGDKQNGGSKNSSDPANRPGTAEGAHQPSADSAAVPSPSDGISRREIEPQAVDDPAQVLAWMAKAPMEFAHKLGKSDVRELESMISVYLKKVSSCISKCYVPNRAAKMKRCMSDILMFFNFFYRRIPEHEKIGSSYLDQMSDLMAYYVDLEIQASSRAKENPLVIANKLTSSLFLHLEKSHDHILDSLLKANNLNRSFWELCSLLLSCVLKETPDKIMSELTYVRYILVYKTWRRIVQAPEERKRITALAASRVKHPPQFVEKIRAGLLNSIIPKVPKKRADVTVFLMQAKFDIKEKSKAFLKYVAESRTNVLFVPTVPAIKTDIPLLVGYLPDFGPSHKFLTLNTADLDDDKIHKIDLSLNRMMNDIWTSVNHEASFREAIRMQNVTSFSSTDLKVKDKKNLLRTLRSKKAVKKATPKAPEAADKSRSDDAVAPRAMDFCDATIVLSDDSDKAPSDVERTRSKAPARGSEKKNGQIANAVSSRQLSDVKIGSIMSVATGAHRQEPTVRCPAAQQARGGTILAPSQIKQEIDLDDVIIVSPPREMMEEEADNGPDFCANVNRFNRENAQAKVSSTFDENAMNDSPTEFQKRHFEVKREKDSPVEGDGFTIRINRDLLETIRCQGDNEKETEADNTATETPRCDEVEIVKEPIQPPIDSAVNPPLFDDEESLSSPNGECQELLQSVVEDFIKRSPSAEDFQTAKQSLTGFPRPGSAVAASLADAGTDYVSGEETVYAKPARPANQTQGVHMSSPGGQKRSDDKLPPRQTAEQSSGLGGNSEGKIRMSPPIDVHSKEVHPSTLRRDLQTFLRQSEFREMFVLKNAPPDVPVPTPVQSNPDTGLLPERCSCVQCKGNFDALLANYHAFVRFRNSFSGKDAQDSDVNNSQPAVSESLEPKVEDDLSMDQREDPGDSSSASSDPTAQLPFKKRQGFSPDTDEEEYGYPGTPMLSIAHVVSRRAAGTPREVQGLQKHSEKNTEGLQKDS